MRRTENPNQRIRQLEAELAKLRIATEAQLTSAAAELETIRRQATARRAPATVFVGHLTQSGVNAKIRKRETGNFYDGGNLVLEVRHGAKPDSNVIASWLFHWTQTLRPRVYKHRSLGLGSARLVPLQDARQKAQHYRTLLDDLKDPKEERLNMLCEEQGEKDRLRTFEQVGDEYFKKKMKASPGYKQRLQQLLRDNVWNKEYKLTTAGETKKIKVGTLPIQRVTRKIILEDCGFEQFWNEQNPSARDLRRVLHKMYGYAREKGYYVGNSPMAWQGGLEHVLPKSNEVHQPKHHARLSHKNAPRFLQEHLRTFRYRRSFPRGIGPDGRPVVAYMVELLLLTGVRVQEVRLAQWQEVDIPTMTWTVPPGHTKWGNREKDAPPHRLPITRSMLTIFQDMEAMRAEDLRAMGIGPSPQDLIFPSYYKRRVQQHQLVAQQTLLRTAKQYLHFDVPETDFTNHGLRTTLNDWRRTKGYSVEWYEAQVHHKPEGKTKQAYVEYDLLDQRRVMMAEWDSYLNTVPLPAKEADNVITMSKRRTS
jgi:integrase